MNSKREMTERRRSGNSIFAFRLSVLAGVFLAIVVLALPSSGRASAADAPQLTAVFGTVVQVTPPETLIVATDSGVVTLSVSSDDVFTGDITSFEDVSEGDRVVASAFVNEDASLTIQRILVKADATATAIRHILGVILESSEGSVSIQDNDGNTLTILVPEGVSIPGSGAVVTVVVEIDGTTGNLTAKDFDLAEDAVKRLQAAADAATDDELREDLETRLENARDQHLTTLERARVALERAKQAAEESSPEDVGRAELRLNDVELQFSSLRQRYDQEATERDERLPELRITGTIRYGEAAWEQESGVFNLGIELSDSVDDTAVRAFTWDASTLAVVPIEVQDADADSVTSLQVGDVAPSQAIPLNSVKSLLPNGSQVIVQYDPNTEPPMATLITLLPPELPEALEAALNQEQSRNFTGFVTLVEETPDLDSMVGVVVVANGDRDQKVAAKVTADTKIEIDGQTSSIVGLAAGMAAEVEFDVVGTSEDSDVTASVDGRLNATRIRARTIVDEKESHITGVITGVDEDARSVKIRPVDGASVTVTAPDNAVIVKDGLPSRFDTLAVGDLILDATRYNRETLVVSRLVAQSPREMVFSGSITGKDRSPNRITVTTADKQVLVVFVTDETEITSESAGAITFEDIKVGSRVLKGAVQPIESGGRIVNVATELAVGPARIATTRGIVRSSDVRSGELVIVTNVVNSSETSEIALLVSNDRRPVMMKNGEQINTIISIQVGDIVESVSYNASTNEILKLSVVSPNIQRVRGFVVEVGEDSLQMETVNGRTVSLAIVDETQITLDGRTVETISKAEAGDTVAQAVYIALDEELSSGVAVQLVLTSMASDPDGSSTPPELNASVIETTVSGVLTDVDGRVWAIGSRRFRVTDETQFFGATPAIGLVAKATLQTSDEGELVAVAISVAGRPDTDPSNRPGEIRPEPTEPAGENSGESSVRITGVVQDLELLDDETFVIIVDEVKITTTPDTEITGEPEAGASVVAVVERNEDGIVTAISLEFTPAEDDSDANGTGVADPTETPVPTITPTPTPSVTPTPTENDSDTVEVRITVEAVNGQLVLAGDSLYLLSPDRTEAIEAGDVLTIRVRETAFSDLTAEQQELVSSNPLYSDQSTAADSAIYVEV